MSLHNNQLPSTYEEKCQFKKQIDLQRIKQI